MRRTLFGEPVLTPDDEDVSAFWMEEFEEYPEGLYARFVQEDDGLWGCELADVSREVQVNDFPSEQAVRDWLAEQRIEVEDIE